MDKEKTVGGSRASALLDCGAYERVRISDVRVGDLIRYRVPRNQQLYYARVTAVSPRRTLAKTGGCTLILSSRLRIERAI